MTRLRPSWQVMLASLAALAALIALPAAGGTASMAGSGFALSAVILLLAGALVASLRPGPLVSAIALFVAAHGTAWMLINGIAGGEGTAGTAYFLLLIAAWLLAWQLVTVLSAMRPAGKLPDYAIRLIVPALFGIWILIMWEAIVRGAGVPFVLLPPPSAIGARLANSIPILAADVNQTIFKAVLSGYIMGCGAGFVVAVLADRFLFLRRGLLPIGNMVSALPIIGIAPIMVMWFGFDWQSKAAVVVVMTFFPMLVNTVAGLAASGSMERDLMRTYASSYWQTLLKLRLPAAAPFIFNALKINSTLALIGAIVAEFFGTPVVGMGFRISTEVGRMNVDMVWAEIAVAALAGSVFYGVIALAERAVTFWHPSIRGG
ncbi:ABC transporter permease [Mesorhizobium sp. Z1-4]|uniref:ABC transporter permease n=1 Tax=Mesorhizobium sp. Z1-4 TaxID=2448478 RepID=UPI000FDC87AE|nr:ABC transporter permease [Mesorhizobium sp. Z1-4]